MCWCIGCRLNYSRQVSVAGCLGYDVLVKQMLITNKSFSVSVAGCLGYDVLEPIHGTCDAVV